MKASGGLADITLMNGIKTQVPALPIEVGGHRLGTRIDLPQVGQHTRELLAGMGYCDADIDKLLRDGVARSA